MSDEELDRQAATEIMGWEFLEVGYLPASPPLPEHDATDEALNTGSASARQLELERLGWLEKVGLEAVGVYYIFVPTDWWSPVEDWQPSKDANADYDVLVHVRNTWNDRDIVGFQRAWGQALMTRLLSHTEERARLEIQFGAILYEPGDYARAALKVLENL